MAPRGDSVFAEGFDVDDSIHESSPSLPAARRFTPPKVDRRNHLFQEVHLDISHLCSSIYMRILRFALERRVHSLAEEDGVEMADFTRQR
jgi:hypothetical protein